MKGKKILAGILSAVMVLATMAMPVFAEETLVTDYVGFKAAITNNASEIKLGADIVIGNDNVSGMITSIYNDCVIDLNGFDLDFSNNNAAIYTYGNVKIIGGTKADGTNSKVIFDRPSTDVFRVYSGLLTIENVTFTGNGTCYCVLHSHGGNVNLDKVTFSGDLRDDTNSQTAFIVDDSCKAIIEIKDSDISTESNHHKVFQNGTYIISGTTNITGSNKGQVKTYAISDDVTINGKKQDKVSMLAYDASGTVAGGYTSLETALTKAPAGSTIKLLEDATWISRKIDVKNEITLDLNGKTVTVDTAGFGTTYATANITFKNGTIDIGGANTIQAIYQANAQNVVVTLDNVSIIGTAPVNCSGAGLFFGNYNNGTKVIFKDSTVNIAATELKETTGKFIGGMDVDIINSDITIANFDGGINNAHVTISGDSSFTLNGCSYALNIVAVTMKDSSTLTAYGCTEPAIKLGGNDRVTSSIILEDTSSIEFYDNKAKDKDGNPLKDIEWRTDVVENVVISVANTATLDATFADGIIDTANVSGKANSVAVKFETTEKTNEYNIVLVAPSVTKLHELTSAQLKFAKSNDEINYEIAEFDKKISVNAQDGDVYLFNLKDGINIIGDENKVTIGKVIFEGYSDKSVDFKVDAAYDNKVVATKGQNIIEEFTVDGNKLIINDKENDGTIDATFKEPECEVTVNVTMYIPVEDNDAKYQDMKVVISGQSLDKPIEHNLGIGEVAKADKNYQIIETLKQNKTYVITVSGAGYRTAKYILHTKDYEARTVNFWNNVRIEGSELEMETGVEDSEANANFIAGDIIKDNKLNIYDLSAVVAYFGETPENTKTAWNKAKYDLDRDGIIDASDVSIVLNAWKALEELNQN